MIYPTASELLQQIDQTLLAASDETMPRMAVKSALATTRHLVRHVELRLKLEKSILLDDIDKTSELLEKIAAYFNSQDGECAAMAHSMRAVIEEAPQLLSRAPDELDRIVHRAKALREQVYVSLAHLQNMPAAAQAAKAYGDVRQHIRDYMRYQIEQEARLIDPAFVGKGPRR